MYNLTVSEDHTYVVGSGQWVVHNTNCIDDLYKMLDENGVELWSDSDAIDYLNWSSAQQGTHVNASTLDETLIAIRPEEAGNVRILLEEWFHTRQQADGRTSTSTSVIYQLEIEAKQNVLDVASEWGLTSNDVSQLQAEITTYQSWLDELNN